MYVESISKKFLFQTQLSKQTIISKSSDGFTGKKFNTGCAQDLVKGNKTKEGLKKDSLPDF